VRLAVAIKALWVRGRKPFFGFKQRVIYRRVL
jgi:hypothetical protein